VYALTHSAFDLGMVGLVQFLPMLVLALAAGHVADRYDRRKVARSCQAIEGCAVALLAIGSATGHLTTPRILAVAAILGAARAFEYPAMSALLPGLVPASLFPQATAIVTSAIQGAIILGPALGGLLYTLGPTAPYATAAALFLAASAASTLIRLDHLPPHREPASFRSLFSGIAFIRSRPAILGSISLDLFAVLLGGATALLPVYARDILHTGPWGLGLLRSAPALGAFATSLVLARKPLRRRVGPTMFGAVIVFGLGTLVFAYSTSIALSLGALLVLGAADVVSVVIRTSLVQINTPDEMRGRVGAVNWMFIGTSNQLGEFESGVTAALFGTVPAVALGGLGTIAVALVWIRLFPALWRTERLDDLEVRRS
ncbi:MAG: MFS transporter, partial [Acidobacteriota bacterium]|nr:MFS transporter [Acidobacteriota bacterium]